MSTLHAQVKQSLTKSNFAIAGEVESSAMKWFISGLKRQLICNGHTFLEDRIPNTRLVLNVIDPDHPQPIRRYAQATFVLTLMELDQSPIDALATGYPFLVRTLGNMVILLVTTPHRAEAHFITVERGHYSVSCKPSQSKRFFAEVYRLIEPLASSQLVINNVFEADLEPELWQGDELTQQLGWAGRKLKDMNLLVTAFPIDEILPPDDMRHLERLYGMGGLSYGNLSARKDEGRFWMSASGVDKSRLTTVGRDILMVSGFDADQPAMILSVPPNIKPRRVSVDAIEHWIIYREHPKVGAIVHLHAWMNGIQSTRINYPCGTIELAEAVAELLREEPDPLHAVVGLKNHGITITGESIPELFRRINGKILKQVPTP